jgi:AAT family amino acid transporter
MIGGGIILYKFLPQIPAIGWTALLGIAVTALNLMDVKWFGIIDSVMSFVKVLAVSMFIIIGLAIWLGLTGSGSFIGTSVLISAPTVKESLFPAGGWAVVLSMVIILVNCAGTELIALSAAESDDPKKHIARDSKRVAISTITAFVVPLAILVLIYPWSKGSLTESIFSAALDSHGFRWAAVFFSFVTLTAAISCANSGLYGTVRALYGLAKEGLAPKILTRLNEASVPSVATWVTIFGCWAFFPLYLFFSGTAFYTWLLAVAGFTGAICWLSISLSHLKFRKKRDGKAPFWTYLSVFLQAMVLLIIPFSKEFRGCLFIGIPALIIPMWVVWRKKQISSRVQGF